jgi:hypothetical protein
MRPVPNGQTPAMARNRVDLPEPDGPLTSTFWPDGKCNPSTSTSAVGQPHPEVVHGNVPGGLWRYRDVGRRRPRRTAGGERSLEAGQSVDHGAPFGDGAVGGDEERQRRLHARERRCRLHHPAQRHATGKIDGAHDQERKHVGDLVVAGGKEGEPLLPRHDGAPVIDDVGKALEQAAVLRILAGEQCDLLGILAHPNEVEAEIGLVALLEEVESDQGPPDEMREPSAENGVEQGCPDKVARNPPLAAE